VGVPAPADFPGAGKHVTAFTDQFGRAPGTWSPYTYDSVNFLVAGAEKAGGFDAEPLTAELQQVTDWRGWTGTVTIDAKTGNRDPATVVVTSVTGDALRLNPQWAAAVGADY
jgi:branched-chain amino acid transport system substrate-binding protein